MMRWLYTGAALLAALGAEASPIILDSNMEMEGYPKVEEGHVLASPLHFAQEGIEVQSDPVINRNYYYFQAFPNSKVPLETLMCIFIVVAFTLIFLAVIMLMHMVQKSRSSNVNSDRERAMNGLRVVGILPEKVDPYEHAEAVAPEAVPLSYEAAMSQEADYAEEDSKDKQSPHAYDTKDDEEKNLKDANEFAGPIVPVLRNDGPTLHSDDESYDGEVDDLDRFSSNHNPENDEAPAYEAPVDGSVPVFGQEKVVSHADPPTVTSVVSADHVLPPVTMSQDGAPPVTETFVAKPGTGIETTLSGEKLSNVGSASPVAEHSPEIRLPSSVSNVSTVPSYSEFDNGMSQDHMSSVPSAEFTNDSKDLQNSRFP